jgi:hypothetical protein
MKTPSIDLMRFPCTVPLYPTAAISLSSRYSYSYLLGVSYSYLLLTYYYYHYLFAQLNRGLWRTNGGKHVQHTTVPSWGTFLLHILLPPFRLKFLEPRRTR